MVISSDDVAKVICDDVERVSEGEVALVISDDRWRMVKVNEVEASYSPIDSRLFRSVALLLTPRSGYVVSMSTARFRASCSRSSGPLSPWQIGSMARLLLSE